MNIKDMKYWIFDMDGTLTVPIHDFPAIRKELGIPESEDILGFINNLPEEEAALKHERLEEIELKLAHDTKAQEGVADLLEILLQRGYHLGILTRNNKVNTAITLKAAGLDRFFEPEAVLTRECAAPKPDPEAIHQLLDLWNGSTKEAVILGDYRHDLDAGKAAGISGIYFDSRGINQWNALADLTIHHWEELIPLV